MSVWGMGQAYQPIASQEEGGGFNPYGQAYEDLSGRARGMRKAGELSAANTGGGSNVGRPLGPIPTNFQTGDPFLEQADPYGLNFKPDLSKDGLSSSAQMVNDWSNRGTGVNEGRGGMEINYRAPSTVALDKLNTDIPLDEAIKQVQQYFQDVSNFYNPGGERERVMATLSQQAGIANDPNSTNYYQGMQNRYLDRVASSLPNQRDQDMQRGRAAYAALLNRYRALGGFGFEGDFTFGGF